MIVSSNYTIDTQTSQQLQFKVCPVPLLSAVNMIRKAKSIIYNQVGIADGKQQS